MEVHILCDCLNGFDALDDQNLLITNIRVGILECLLRLGGLFESFLADLGKFAVEGLSRDGVRLSDVGVDLVAKAINGRVKQRCHRCGIPAGHGSVCAVSVRK